MDYKKHYNNLMKRSPTLEFKTNNYQCPRWKNRDGEYREGHRIVPGCMGGVYSSENTRYLTPEEHYIAHQLLIKIYPNNGKLIAAALYMSVNAQGEKRNNKIHGWLKRKSSDYFSNLFKGKRFSPATEFKKGVRYNPDTEFKKGQIPPNKGKPFKEWAAPGQLENIIKARKLQAGKPGAPRTEEWNKNISESRKGKGLGQRNGMADPVNKAKVGASKVGRKGYVNDSGHRIMVFPGTEPAGYKRVR